MQTRKILGRKIFASSDSIPQTIRRQSVIAEEFDDYLEMFQSLHPHLYDIWKSINLEKNIEEFRERPQFSCGTDVRIDARLFAGFIAPYLHGYVLDVGCGPYAVPNYLDEYPTELISGIDPLEPFTKHPFEFIRGFAEFLPWNENSFDVVITATSLDHVLDLDLAISEIMRVLKPDGVLLVWEWFSDQAEPYQPKEKKPELVDNYHLFNFDEIWFESYMKNHFWVDEKMRLFGEHNHYYYYCLRKISSPGN